MTLGQNGDSIRYSLHMSSAVKNHAKDLHSQQAELGRGKAYIDAFRYILERLQREPLVLGEPSYALPALHLQVRRAAVFPIIVDYAVHDSQPLVFIRGVSLLPLPSGNA
jgi:hypothetical protein